jgi:hypothetical protein
MPTQGVTNPQKGVKFGKTTLIYMPERHLVGYFLVLSFQCDSWSSVIEGLVLCNVKLFLFTPSGLPVQSVNFHGPSTCTNFIKLNH